MDIPVSLKGVDVSRALKDSDYRATLTAEQQSALSEIMNDPELSDEDLEEVAGGSTYRCTTSNCTTLGCRAPGEDVPIS